MVQISARLNKGATGFGHFGTVNGDITMNKYVAWLAEVTAFQHGWPEQAMEVNDVFTDEVIQLGRGVFFPEFVEVQIVTLVAQVFK